MYRLLLGAALLVVLYFDLQAVLYAMIGLLLAESLFNLRVSTLVNRLRGLEDGDPQEGSLGIAFTARTHFEAERGWRVLVACVLFLSVVVFAKQLWFFPWFMGFALMGAGISGVCPAYLALKWAGLK